MNKYNLITKTSNFTVVAKYESLKGKLDCYQSEITLKKCLQNRSMII